MTQQDAGVTCAPLANQFEFHNEPKSWHDAAAACELRGGNLASIHSENENQLVFQLAGTYAWIGLNNLYTEGTFEYSDGTPLDF